MSRLLFISILLATGLWSTVLSAAALSLSEATQRVLTKNPQISLSDALEQAAAGRASQAGILPNPELSYQLEDFSRDTQRSANQATTTFSLSQQFSLPGKRSARMAVANDEQALAKVDGLSQRLSLIRLTHDRYAEAVAAQEQLSIAEQSHVLAKQAYDAVSARVDAGRVSPIELSRASVALKAAQREVATQKQFQLLAQRQLASLWGERELVESLTGSLVLPQSLTEDVAPINKIPLLKRADIQVKKEQAALRLAQAERVPDFTLMAGMKRDADTRDESLLIGVSIPIPLFNRNQGSVLSARSELAAAEAEQALIKQQWVTLRDQLETQRAASYQEALQLRDDVLRVAREAAEATQIGYQAGKFSLLDLLDAQRILIDSQSQYLSARLSFFRSNAALNELLGFVHSDGNSL